MHEAFKRVLHEEIAERYKQKRKGRRVTLTALRIRDLSRLFDARYGETLPDDDSGRDDVRIMAQHLVNLPAHPRERITAWCQLRAPWLPIGELRDVIRDALEKPRKWRADKLGWRLRLIEEDRRALKITTIGSVDVGKAERIKRRKEANRIAKLAKRRAAGVKPRAEYLAGVSLGKPWVKLGISRASYYRRRK